MRRLLLAAVLFLAVVLTSCQTCSPRLVPAECTQVIISVSTGPTPWTERGPADGFTSGIGKPYVSVVIRENLTVDRAIAVTIHELWHATGHRGHPNGLGCYTHSCAGGIVYPMPPCAAELAQMRAVTNGPYIVHAAHPWVEAVMQAACMFWNFHTGMDLFACVD